MVPGRGAARLPAVGKPEALASPAAQLCLDTSDGVATGAPHAPCFSAGGRFVSIANVLGRLGEERALELQLRFAEIPSATFDESRRAEAVAAAWKAAGLEPEIDESGSVVAFRPGGADGPVLCIGAHLDTVFPIDEDYSVRRPGQWCERCEEPGIVPDGEYHGPGVSDCAAGLASRLASCGGRRALS